MVWAQRQLHPVDTGSWLYIATVDKEDPWQLTSERTAICKPDYGWDNNGTFVVEGPFVLQKDSKIYLTFSGSGTDHTYCVGLLTASEDGNLLEASSWRKRNFPIFTSWSVAGQYGPGHNAYIMDDDGLVYNIYHAKWNKGIRSASIRRVHFDMDGEPVLDMVEERDLLDEYKSVSMQVIVPGKDEGSADLDKEPNPPIAPGATSVTNKPGSQTTESEVSVKKSLAVPKVTLKKKSKTKLNVRWKKIAGASGYKVQYSLKKKSGFKTITIKKGKTTGYTISRLKKGKTYYVRVCAYRTVKGKKISGKWSKAKTIKLK